MSAEVELKLGLAESDQRRFLRLPELHTKAVAHESASLVNIYYDTADLALHRHGIALRLRKIGQRWLQTVKCAGVSEGGLSIRPEWETDYSGRFDFTGVANDKVRAWLDRPKLRARLLPIFETSFRRTTWTFGKTSRRRVQLMFDRGWIAAAGNRCPISELELELQGGPVDQVFSLAEALARHIPLMPLTRSKAERGYRLFLAQSDVPVKAAPVALHGQSTPAEAFRHIAFACLEQLHANQSGALATDDPEYVHQMRVALRRLRAALRLFRPCLPQEVETTLLWSLRELIVLLGEARDFDVLLSEITTPVSRALPDEPRLAMLTGLVTERRHMARQNAISAMRQATHGFHLIHATRLIQRIQTTGQELPALDAFASHRLQRLYRKVRLAAAAARADDPVSLHALRICIKRLRYAIEFFGSLHKVGRFNHSLDLLARCQDELGQLNDLASAGERLMQCASDDPRLREAVTLIAGWHGTRYQKLLEGVQGMLLELQSFHLTNSR